MRVHIDFTPEQFQIMQRKALVAGYNDIPSFIKAQHFTDYAKLAQELLTEALSKARDLPVGTVFTVKQLFDSNKWQEIPMGLRRLLGKNFYKAHNAHPIKHLGPNAAKQTSYKKL